MHEEPSGVRIMAYTTIDDPSAHFQTAIYTGNGSANLAITNDGNSDLQPDLVWIKNRDATDFKLMPMLRLIPIRKNMLLGNGKPMVEQEQHLRKAAIIRAVVIR